MMTQVEKEFLLFQEWAATEFKFAHRVSIPQCTYVFICAFVCKQCHAKMQYTHIRTYSNALDCNDCRVPRTIPCSLLLTHSLRFSFMSTDCNYSKKRVVAISQSILQQPTQLSCSENHNRQPATILSETQQHTQSFFLSPVDTYTSIHLNRFSRANTHTHTHRQTCVYVHKTSTI